MSASIKERIYLSFSLLVGLFVINGIITIITLNKSDKLSTHLSKVVDPTLEALVDFRKMMQQSDLYTTNSVFFKVREEDKMLLKKLHTQDYPALKSRINTYSSQWQMNSWVDSLNKVFTGFEQLLVIEKSIMENLDDTKETERGVEDEVIPRSEKLSASLKTIHSHWLSLRTEENKTVESSSKNLRLLIILSAAAIILLGIFLSLYMARVIISPIHRISHIVNGLGKGIIKKVDHKVTGDEIGEMVRSVNNLSEKLQGTAAFAAEIGNRNFDSYFEPLGPNDTLGKALVAMRDNLKKSDESLNESQFSLEKNNRELGQKNKELEQFAYVASHDLQEPLRTITSFVQIFKQQYFGKLDSKSDKYLTYIMQASDRMRVLIKDLLDYSRIGNNRDLEQVDSAIVLHDVIADIHKAIKDSHAEIQAEDLPVISGYTTELKQLFQNLILNSIKFRKKDIPLKINIAAQKKNEYWRFAVTDNGIGIDKDHYERIFIIFQRLHTRSEYQGSGIGLSHCKKIVELHHGKIWVESTHGEGSTFYFTIASAAPVFSKQNPVGSTYQNT